MDDPAQALQAVENAVRLVVRELCPDWTRHISDVDRLRQKQGEDQRRRDGVLLTDDRLSYVEFHDLTEIVLKEWEAFKPVFDDKKRTEVWFNVLLDTRNSIAHSRHLAQHERELVSGASRQLRNQVTIFRTRNDPVTSHYAVIESAYDHLGRTPTGTLLDMFMRNPASNPSPPRVEVGDELEFECLGSDSKNRPLEWSIVIVKRDDQSIALRTGTPITGTAPSDRESERATVRVTVPEEFVCENLTVSIFLRAAKGRHFRYEGSQGLVYAGFPYDDVVTFTYAVNPPVE